MSDATEIEPPTPDIVEPPVVADVVPDAPWPERVARIKYHGGWGVKQLPPEPPKEA